MNFALRAGTIFACLGTLATAQAAPAAIVEAIQAPAWVERDGKRLPAAPGMELRNRDRIITGNEARTYVLLGDGSTVKFGENGQADFNAFRQQSHGLFTAAIDVAKGSFRLTTNALRKLRTQRAINVRVGTITAGIRGTDLWGRSDAAYDFICLLEGKIVVNHPQASAVELNEALQYYGADKDQAPGPVGTVDQEKVTVWSASTDLKPGTATLSKGPWAVKLSTAGDEESALALYDRVTGAGYPVRIQPQKTAEGYAYQLLVGPFADASQAEQLASKLAEEFELTQPSPVRRQAAFRNRQ